MVIRWWHSVVSLIGGESVVDYWMTRNSYLMNMYLSNQKVMKKWTAPMGMRRGIPNPYNMHT